MKARSASVCQDHMIGNFFFSFFLSSLSAIGEGKKCIFPLFILGSLAGALKIRLKKDEQSKTHRNF